ncbi:tetratricopeptide repeat protein [Variovorax soli]|uniref:tetratricopeptide repeat protein n=1 Tax=Variovorax soli TaxID=376815 RepID=UPI000838E7CB
MTFPPRRLRLAAVALLAISAGACASLDPTSQADSSPAAAPSAAPAPAAPQAAPGSPVAAPLGPPSAPPPKTESPAVPSAMTAQIFYEVLVGELTLRTGDPGTSYTLLLDSARRTRDPQLFQRATEIALQSRSGDAALAAARAWKQAIPDSRDARRLELQILIALNRLSETVEPLRAELAATPQVEKPVLMNVIARNYARASDKKLAASVVEQALSEELKTPAMAAPAWAAIGRVRLAAEDNAGALEAARKGLQADPAGEAPAILALELMDANQADAEGLIKTYLDNPKASPGVRMGYARELAQDRRYAEASSQLSTLTRQNPDLPDPWLLLGSLQAQAKQDAAAEKSVKKYLALAEKQQDGDERSSGMTQAYFVLSQTAERRKDYSAAENWLAKIDNPDDLTATQLRRAALLARQGKLEEGRQVIRALPSATADQRRQKLLAEVQLLRDTKHYQEAYDLLAQASAAAPNDADLIYDQAMVAEKLNRMDEMERLLRRLIAMKPDNQNAYNALGYSLADRKLRLDEARTLIQKAVQLAPDDPFIADSLGWVEFRMGNTQEATRILEAAYKQRPDPEIGAHLGEVLWVSGQRDRAMAIWKEAVQADAENETLQETLKRLRVKP